MNRAPVGSSNLDPFQGGTGVPEAGLGGLALLIGPCARPDKKAGTMLSAAAEPVGVAAVVCMASGRQPCLALPGMGI